ncbi:gamma-glutamyl-gamma-aminobutyrate hydrolase family protein [Sinorhizobium fredii]|uniref:gamma-glutamyl-gamma-aminobutyrate hydrolase family protein n=1 Tax=Rhizobium fredii TaxID=380 RepID=UPI003B9802A3
MVDHQRHVRYRSRALWTECAQAKAHCRGCCHPWDLQWDATSGSMPWWRVGTGRPSGIQGAFEHKPDQTADHPQHQISVVNQPRHLAGVETGRYPVNSVHHEAVLPAAAYREIAVASDGLIEALEARDGGFAVGVRWHPKYAISAIDRVMVQSFVSAASQYSLKN